MKKFSKLERSYCLITAIVFDILGFSIIYEPQKPPTKDELDKKIEDFKKMISRGETEWE